MKLIGDNLDSDQLVWLGSNWGPVTKRFDSMPGAYLPILDVCYELFPNCSFDANTNFTFSAGAQYIVPRRLITNKSLNWWNHCYDVFKQYLNHPRYKLHAPIANVRSNRTWSCIDLELHDQRLILIVMSRTTIVSPVYLGQPHRIDLQVDHIETD